MHAILQIIADVENATQRHATFAERAELADWLDCSSWTLGQIRAASESVSMTETYGRPLSREHWHKAFAEPAVHPKRLRELCRHAYENGRKDEREEISPEASGSGMDTITKRLLEAEKELMTLREERKNMQARNRELERECRELKRRAGESTARFYRKDDRLIVEHFRENGQVYYHEQHVDETEIPSTRGRRMSEADFDRQIAEHSVQILTEDEVDRLPGFSLQTSHFEL